MAKSKKNQELENEAVLESYLSKVDQNKVENLKKEIEKYKKDLTGKEYAVPMSAKGLELYEKYMTENVEWRGKEGLGVIEISKRIQSIKKEGLKDEVCYMSNLEIEASHYFLMKWNGKGTEGVEDYIKLLRGFEESLMLIQQDNLNLKEIEQKLSAAEQGLELQ